MRPQQQAAARRAERDDAEQQPRQRRRRSAGVGMMLDDAATFQFGHAPRGGGFTVLGEEAAAAALAAACPVRVYAAPTTGSDDGQPEQCSVCLCEFEPGEQVRTLPCAHFFHAACIDRWFERKRECPLCKFDCEPAFIVPAVGEL